MIQHEVPVELEERQQVEERRGRAEQRHGGREEPRRAARRRDQPERRERQGRHQPGEDAGERRADAVPARPEQDHVVGPAVGRQDGEAPDDADLVRRSAEVLAGQAVRCLVDGQAGPDDGDRDAEDPAVAPAVPGVGVHRRPPQGQFREHRQDGRRGRDDEPRGKREPQPWFQPAEQPVRVDQRTPVEQQVLAAPAAAPGRLGQLGQDLRVVHPGQQPPAAEHAEDLLPVLVMKALAELVRIFGADIGDRALAVEPGDDEELAHADPEIPAGARVLEVVHHRLSGHERRTEADLGPEPRPRGQQRAGGHLVLLSPAMSSRTARFSR